MAGLSAPHQRPGDRPASASPRRLWSRRTAAPAVRGHDALAVAVAASADRVCAYAADPAHLPAWAAGLARSTVEQVDGHRVAESPVGRVRVDLARADDLGVLDHTVTLPGGEQVLDPMRVIPDGEGCEVVFTVRRRAGTSEADLERDCRAVLTDLTLRSLLEHS